MLYNAVLYDTALKIAIILARAFSILILILLGLALYMGIMFIIVTISGRRKR